LKARSESFIDIDGIRLNNDHGWWLIRASNTQPVIVARCESKTLEGLSALKTHLQEILLTQSLVISGW
jgi:phosphomannomutase